jgi:GT2 family glycosyltransferase
MNRETISSELCIIIVNWNTRDLLEKCLRSIQDTVKSISFKIIVVDNASSDDSVNIIKDQFPEVTLIENRENLGFAKANNQAIEVCDACEYILLLNPDTVLKPDAIHKLVQFLEEHNAAGAVAPALCYPNGKPQAAGGYDLSILTAFNYFLFPSVLFPNVFKGFFIDHKRIKNRSHPVELDWIAGTCLLLKKRVVEQAGGLNESYFLYAEDAEWCARIRKAGWKIFFLPDVEIIHYHGASSQSLSSQWISALIDYIREKKGITSSLLFRFIAATGLGIRSILYFSAYILTKKKEYCIKASQMFFYFKGTLSSNLKNKLRT